FFRRQCELIEAIGSRLTGWQKVERKYGWSACRQRRRSRDLFTRQRSDNYVGTVLRRTRYRFSDAAFASVINTHRTPLRLWSLIVRGHETVAHGDGCGGGSSGDGQQQSNPRDVGAIGDYRGLLYLLAQQFASNNVARRMIWMARPPCIHVCYGPIRISGGQRGDGRELEPAPHERVARRTRIDTNSTLARITQ